MTARPEVVLVDARREGLDEEGLRRRARGEGRGAFCSRSYRYPYALVASHEAPVGIDIERLMPFDAAFAQYVCTRDELERLGQVADAGAYLTRLWAGKEALAKALGDALAYEPSRLEAPEAWPDGSAGRWRALRLTAPAGHAAWLCWADPAG